VTNVSYWERHLTECDALIIGAGFLGSWIAKKLVIKHPNMRVIVVERSNKSYGASIRNAGFATSGSITEILADERNFGTEAAFNIVRQRRDGIREIENAFGIYGLDGFDQCGGYELFTDENKTEITENIARINSALGGFELREDGVFVAEDGLIDSWKLLDLLHHTTEWRGCQDFIFGADVQDLIQEPDGVLAIVGLHGRQITIKTKKVISCMNGFTASLLPNTQIRPQRNHVMVTGVLDSDVVGKYGYHAEEGYVYWRPVYENGTTRLLIGGMRHRSLDTENTRNFAHNQFIWDELTKFVEENITDQFTIDYQWTGIMGFTGNKQNLLERHAENIYAACCCNGQGVAMAPVFATEVIEKVFA
jgi:glycine/D-amino acid oxidase-like deaminating enzyme